MSRSGSHTSIGDVLLHAQISADMDVSPGGRVSFREDDSYSLNLAPITVQVEPVQRPSLCAAIRGVQYHPMLRQ